MRILQGYSRLYPLQDLRKVVLFQRGSVEIQILGKSWQAHLGDQVILQCCEMRIKEQVRDILE